MRLNAHAFLLYYSPPFRRDFDFTVYMYFHHMLLISVADSVGPFVNSVSPLIISLARMPFC